MCVFDDGAAAYTTPAMEPEPAGGAEPEPASLPHVSSAVSRGLLKIPQRSMSSPKAPSMADMRLRKVRDALPPHPPSLEAFVHAEFGERNGNGMPTFIGKDGGLTIKCAPSLVLKVLVVSY